MAITDKDSDSQISNDNDIKIIIRDAQQNDAAAVAQLLDELGYPNTPEFALAKIKKLSGRRRDRVLIAEKDSRVVGILSLHIMPLLHKKGDLCRVSALVVRQENRGQYVGCRLMEMAETYARVNNCSCIEITSGDQRLEAHEFYHKIGYIKASKRFVKSLNDQQSSL